MTPNEAIEYFNESRHIRDALGIEQHTWIYWAQVKKIPYDAQVKLQELSLGELTASHADAPRPIGFGRMKLPYTIRSLSVQSAIHRKPLAFHCSDCYLSYIDVIATSATPDNVMLLGTIEFRNNFTGEIVQCLFKPIKGSGIEGDLQNLIDVYVNEGVAPNVSEIDWSSF